MGNKINVNINGLSSLSFPSGTPLYETKNDYKKITGKSVIGAKIGTLVVDLSTKLYEDTKVEFFDYRDPVGNKMYQAGLKFILIIAAKTLWKKEVSFKYSLDKGIYAKVDKKLSDDDVLSLKAKMQEIVDYDYPIKKCITKREDAIKYYLSTDEDEKRENIHNIPNRYVELFEINHNYNFFYSPMPFNTGELSVFDIKKIDSNSIVLLYPRCDSSSSLPKWEYNEKIYAELLKYTRWSVASNTCYVSDLNKIISSGSIQKFIAMNDIFLDESLYAIAKDIVKKKGAIKLILLGGPSSSGKTTSTHKLCTYLETFGINPIMISADDYFKERIDNPKDENGKYDFDTIEAMDLTLFNDHLKRLLKGEEVVVPKFNFVTGIKEYVRDPIKLHENDVLLIEGIHCLNDLFTKSIKRENKYKILICPFTPLALDRHNHLSTTDMRLIRRIVRDNRMRGKTVEVALEEWKNVRKGEENYIFPYTLDIDAVLNTAHAYEMGILRVFAEPLLYSVQLDSVYYEEARRLLGLLRMFYPISSEYVKEDNVLREFIGGSIYEK